jgi:UDP-N-acetylglucosamine--N-acetylmuramyl-(pentapeptide) pyrophosphoryl-undecaprenol N-acetylglucosamine transferase
MGGSQGAKSINEAAIGTIEYFKDNDNIQIILQTGEKNYKDVIEKLGEFPKNALIRPYFENMVLPLLASDIVVSRAGSLSISEICACGLPSILVPYPHSAANHQEHNAKKMEELGATLCVEDKDLSADVLTALISDILQNPNKLTTMHSCALAEAKVDAIENIVEQLFLALEK